MHRLLLCTAMAATASCADDAPAPASDAAIDAPGTGFDRRALLEHVASAIVIPAHAQLVTDATALAEAVALHCAATPELARAAWRTTIDTWERVDAILLGPAAMDDKALRDRIYAWPLVATCGVDREVVAHHADPAAYDVGAELDNVRSLAALEYLLFEDATTHTCATPITGWDDLGAELPAARCGLATAIADDVAAQTQLALGGWDAYHEDLVEAGTASSAIPTLREAVNLVSDAFFYVDKMVKDMKLGEAAGIAINACGTVQAPCEREVEHRHADHATAAIRINLATLREAFTGTTTALDGPGFDDYLREVGAAALADEMTAELDAAIAAASALPDSFLGALADDYDLVVAAHAALKPFTDDLKSQFLTVLGLDIPDDVAGDND